MIMDLILGCLAQIWDSKSFFAGFAPTSSTTLFQAIILHNFKENYRKKLEKWQKKLVLDPILAPLAQIWTPKFFSWILPLLDARHFCKLSLHAISRKTNEPNLRKWQNLVSGLILVHLAQIQAANMFFQKPSSVSH